MTFYPDDVVFYNLTKRKYIVERCYFIKHDGITLELIDVKPLEKLAGDKFRKFKGYNAKYFTITKK